MESRMTLEELANESAESKRVYDMLRPTWSDHAIRAQLIARRNGQAEECVDVED
jgi:hypothetical protein